MDNRPFFSVCIPNYNYFNYVGATIESVLNQSFQNFEIIIVDNASTDASWTLIQDYAKKDSRIKCFQNNCNIGFAPNLQRATEKAMGRFVILLSSDDLMFRDALNVYHEIIEAHADSMDNLVLHSAFDQITSTGQYVRTGYNIEGEFKIKYVEHRDYLSGLSPSYFFQDPLAALRFALKTNYGIAAFLTTCYSKKLWEAVEGYDPHYLIFPDKAFLFKILLKEPNYVYVNRSLFGYRIHPNNQNATNAGMASLKHQMDGYLRVINFPADDLKKLSLTSAELQQYYIKNLCEKHSFSALKQNQRMKSFKIFCFAFASFPTISFKNKNLWILFFLLLLGPLGTVVLRSLAHFYRRSET